MVPDRPAVLPERSWSRELAPGAGRFPYREHGFTLGGAGRGEGTVVRHVLHRGDSAYVLPVDRAAGQVVLCRQFRAGGYLAGAADGYTLEAPGGLVEGGDPEAVARRECAEETGVVLDALVRVASVLSHPTLMPERNHLFVAECVLGGSGGRFGSGTDEETEAVVLPLSRLRGPRADVVVDDMRTALLLALLDAPDGASRSSAT